jgi:hypothetical protein
MGIPKRVPRKLRDSTIFLPLPPSEARPLAFGRACAFAGDQAAADLNDFSGELGGGHAPMADR